MKISLQRCHTLKVEDSAFSHKIDNFFLEILSLEGHPNRITGLKVMAILLNGCILSIGGVAWEGSAPAACAAGLYFAQY